jgi:hypothetical protein
MMRDKHEITGDVNIPCEAYDGQSSPQHHWKTDTQYNTAHGDEGEVYTTIIEQSVEMQHERPSRVDLTPYGKQLPHRCNGSEELIVATVHLVTQKLWGAYLDVPSALSTGFDKGLVRTLCCVEVVSRVDGTNRCVGILGRFILVCIQAEQFMSCFQSSWRTVRTSGGLRAGQCCRQMKLECMCNKLKVNL